MMNDECRLTHAFHQVYGAHNGQGNTTNKYSITNIGGQKEESSFSDAQKFPRPETLFNEHA